MKTLHLLLLPLILPCAIGAADSTLVWSDEFEGSGLPDPARWTWDAGGDGWGNQEAQLYTRNRISNAHREGGNLVVSALREDTGACWYGPCRFTSARLLTRGRADWRYGRVDVRARIPSGRGGWPAVWMLPTASAYGGWPDGGEIDIMENVGFEPDRAYATLHFHGNGQAQGVATSSSLSGEFHLYSLRWSRDSLSVLFDGATILRYARTGDWRTWPFDQRFFLILDLAVGGQWGGQQGVDTAGWSRKDLLVDYVRVWKFAQGAGPFAPVVRIRGRGSVVLDPARDAYPSLSRIAVRAVPAEGWEFAGWSGALAGGRDLDTLVVAGDDTVEALFAPAGEQVANGDFGWGLSGWIWWADPSVGGGPSLSAAGEACLRPGAAGAQAWMAQWKWPGIPVRAGESFDLSFRARASRSRPLQAGLVQDRDPFGNLAGSWNAQVGPTAVTYYHRFEATSTDSVGRLEFDLGTDTATLCLDSISLRRIGAAGGLETRLRRRDGGWGLQAAVRGGRVGSRALRDLLGRVGATAPQALLVPPERR